MSVEGILINDYYFYVLTKLITLMTNKYVRFGVQRYTDRGPTIKYKNR